MLSSEGGQQDPRKRASKLTWLEALALVGVPMFIGLACGELGEPFSSLALWVSLALLFLLAGLLFAGVFGFGPFSVWSGEQSEHQRNQ